MIMWHNFKYYIEQLFEKALNNLSSSFDNNKENISLPGAW